MNKINSKSLVIFTYYLFLLSSALSYQSAWSKSNGYGTEVLSFTFSNVELFLFLSSLPVLICFLPLSFYFRINISNLIFVFIILAIIIIPNLFFYIAQGGEYFIPRLRDNIIMSLSVCFTYVFYLLNDDKQKIIYNLAFFFFVVYCFKTLASFFFDVEFGPLKEIGYLSNLYLILVLFISNANAVKSTIILLLFTIINFINIGEKSIIISFLFVFCCIIFLSKNSFAKLFVTFLFLTCIPLFLFGTEIGRQINIVISENVLKQGVDVDQTSSSNDASILSGRIELWGWYIQGIYQNWFLGNLGYVPELLTKNYYSVHNIFLELAVLYGVIPAVIIILIIARPIINGLFLSMSVYKHFHSSSFYISLSIWMSSIILVDLFGSMLLTSPFVASFFTLVWLVNYQNFVGERKCTNI